MLMQDSLEFDFVVAWNAQGVPRTWLIVII